MEGLFPARFRPAGRFRANHRPIPARFRAYLNRLGFRRGCNPDLEYRPSLL
jgi:hypothetical protein